MEIIATDKAEEQTCRQCANNWMDKECVLTGNEIWVDGKACSDGFKLNEE